MGDTKAEMPSAGAEVIDAAGVASAETRADASPSPELPDEPRRRAHTMSRKEMARDLRRRLKEGLDPDERRDLAELERSRPRTRADCAQGERPCIFVSCRFHLYLDVNPRTGSVKLNFPDKELWELKDTCALDVADRGGVTLEEVGDIMNLTRERVRQVEARGLVGLRVLADDDDLPPDVDY